MPEKLAKQTVKRARRAKPTTKRPKPEHSAIAERAYFIHLEEGTCDEVGHWLRAERELAAA
jgi:Protein of unknown function (DUF2934)